MAADIYHWTEEDPEIHKIDTIYQADPYFLWESDGDLEQQAEERRALGPKIMRAPGVITEKGQKGNLMSDYLAYFYYRVFTYEYPSVDANGNTVILSSIAACPEKGACSQVRDIVIGTHITICSNNECPTNCTNNYKESNWGVLFSLAGGKKIKLGWYTNAILAGLTILGTSPSQLACSQDPPYSWEPYLMTPIKQMARWPIPLLATS